MNIKKRYLAGMAIATAVMMTSLYFLYFQPPKINCSGAVNWAIRNERFVGGVTYHLHNQKGVVTLTGLFSATDNRRYKISRSVYFHYQQRQRYYIVQSDSLIRFPSDNLHSPTLAKSMPDVYLKPGGQFSFLIERFRGMWLFTTVGGTSLVCRDE